MPPVAESLPFLPVLSEGAIRVVLLVETGLSRVFGKPLIPMVTVLISCQTPPVIGELNSEHWSLQPFLEGLTPQRNIVMLKAAVAAVLEPEARILQVYTRSTNQECPPSETPVERLKKAFQEFTESIESS